MSAQQSCYLCEEKEFKKRPGIVRDNPNLELMECVSCGLVFLSSFSHICEEFYYSSKMHEGETSKNINAWLRETIWDDQRRFYMLKKSIKNKSILDFGCGTGYFLLLARELASRVVGIEVEARLKSRFQKVGLDVCILLMK